MPGFLDFKALGRRQQPLRVPTDEVLSVSNWDGNPSMAALQGWTMLRFDTVLDPNKLRDSLWRLVEIGDWRKLGGRFRRSKEGKLEIHIPKEFSALRPAIGFSHTNEKRSIHAHALASKLPRPTPGRSCVHHGPAESFTPLSRCDATPKNLDDYLYNDVPSLWLNVVSFTDATVVALTWPHATMDGTGLSCVLQAWAFVLAGQEALLPPVLSKDHDLMGALSSDEGAPGVPEERYFMADRLMKGVVRIFVYIMLVTLRCLFAGTVETKMVYIPKTTVSKLRQEALASLEDSAPLMTAAAAAAPAEEPRGDTRGSDISSGNGSGKNKDKEKSSSSSSPGVSATPPQSTNPGALSFIPGGLVADRVTGRPFISDSDVLQGFFARVASRVLGVRSRRTVNITTLINVRDRIPSFARKVQGDQVGVHLTNVCMTVQTLLPANAVIPGAGPCSSLGVVSAAVRASVAAATTEPQLRAFARLQAEVQNKDGRAMFPIVGDRSNHSIVFSSLDVGPLYEMNVFEPAVVASKPATQGAVEGREKEASAIVAAAGLQNGSVPVGFLVQPEKRDLIVRQVGIFIVGRGRDGTWVQGSLSPALWKVAEEELAAVDRRAMV